MAGAEGLAMAGRGSVPLAPLVRAAVALLWLFLVLILRRQKEAAMLNIPYRCFGEKRSVLILFCSDKRRREE